MDMSPKQLAMELSSREFKNLSSLSFVAMYVSTNASS